MKRCLFNSLQYENFAIVRGKAVSLWVPTWVKHCVQSSGAANKVRCSILDGAIPRLSIRDGVENLNNLKDIIGCF